MYFIFFNHRPAWTAGIPVYYEHWGERWYLLCATAKCFCNRCNDSSHNSTVTNQQTMKSKYWPTSPPIDMLVLKCIPEARLSSNQTRCDSLGTVGALHWPSLWGNRFPHTNRGLLPQPWQVVSPGRHSQGSRPILGEVRHSSLLNASWNPLKVSSHPLAIDYMASPDQWHPGVNSLVPAPEQPSPTGTRNF